MDYFVENYLETCKAEFSQYGFKQKRKAFVRVINDVMQNFTLEKLRSGRACRVEFAIIPLCLRIEKDYITGGVYSHNLRRFEPAHWTHWDQWEYDPKSEKSMNNCIDEMIMQIKKHLMPLFCKANSCKTAYDELCELDREFYGNVKNMRENDKKYFQNGVNMLDNTKYYMALKNGNYDIAVAYLKAIEQQNVDSYNSMDEGGYLTGDDRTRREENLVKIRYEIETISKCDESYIQGLIKESEEYSLNNLKGII